MDYTCSDCNYSYRAGTSPGLERIKNMSLHICDNITNPNHIVQTGDYPMPKISIIEKISKNRKLILKRTLAIGGGIIGGLLLVGFLTKERFEDDTVEIPENEDGSFTVTSVEETPEEN